MSTEKQIPKPFIIYHLIAVAVGLIYQLYLGQLLLVFISSLQLTIYGTIAALYNTPKTQKLFIAFTLFSAVFFYLLDDGIAYKSGYYLNYLSILFITYTINKSKADKNILDSLLPFLLLILVFLLVNFANTPKLIAQANPAGNKPIYFFIHLASFITIGSLCIKKLTQPIEKKDENEPTTIPNLAKTNNIQLQSLIENTDNAIWSIDKNYAIIYGNNAFYKTFQLLYSREIKQGDVILEGANMEEISYWKNAYDAAFEGKTVKLQKQAVIADKTLYFDLSFSPVIEDAQMVGVTINATNVTNQICYQLKIAEKEKNLENLIDSLEDIVFEFDENLRCKNVWINEEGKLSHSKEHYIGKTLSESVEQPFVKQLEKALLQTFNTGEIIKFDYQQEIKGKLAWFSVQTKLVKNQDPRHILMIVEDIDARKKQEIRTLRQRDFLNKLIETLPVGIFAKDAKNDMVYVLWNKELENMFGILQKDVLGKTDFDIFHTDDTIDDYTDTDGMVAQSKEPLLLSNLSINTPYGTIITKTIKVPLLDENNEPDLIIGIIEDVTEIQQTQKELEAAEKRWNFALTGSRDGVWDFDLIQDSIYYSPMYKEMLGYKANELDSSTLSWENTIHPDDINQVLQSFTDHIYGRTLYYQNEHRKIKKDGSTIWILDKGKVAETNAEGKPIRFIGTITDITSRKELEAKADKTEKLLESISDNIKEGIYRVNSTHHILYANKPFLNMFGYQNMEEVISIHTSEFYYNKVDRDVFVEEIRTINNVENKEILFKRQDGSTFWGLLSSKRLVDENGEEFFDGAIRDVSEIKKIEHQLIKAKEAAEEAAKVKSTFLSTMSHEIRTPMNAVVGISNILMQEQHLPAQTESLEILNSSAQNLMHLLNDILDFSKIEAGKVELEKIDLDIHRLIKEIKHLALINATEKTIEIITSIDEQIPQHLLGDPTRISQILFNLVSNAIKFTHEGSVSIKVKLVESTATQSTVYFEVADTGIGIAQENLSNIFDQFTQASNDITRKFGGTGLGLAIIKKLITLHHSTIYVESEVNKGSKFYFTIAFDKNSKPTSEIETDTANKFEPLDNMHILIAEDNKINVFVATKFIKNWGIKYDIAENGQEALEKAKAYNYDLILMDLQMPQMDGFEAASAIRKFNKKTPIFALTANALNEVKQEVLAAGMNDFITKPFDPNELYLKIKAVKNKNNLSLFDTFN